MKDDAPLPGSVPRKRRQIEGLLDRHIAIWLAGNDITPSDRRKLEEEKARRRATVPDRPIGVIVGESGATPEQLAALPTVLAGATVIHHPGVASKIHNVCREVAPVEVVRQGPSMVIRRSTELVYIVSLGERTNVKSWQYVRAAKHRSLPVKCIAPDGAIDQGES